MIDVIGDEGTSEHRAAIAITKALENIWPGLSTSSAQQEHVRVSVGVKISGYKVSDIDIVACGVFHRERKFIPRRVIHDSRGKRLVRQPVTVQNFVIVIEVKDHDENGVLVSGDNISVKYSRGGSTHWKSATEQNVNQLHSLQNYLKDRGQSVFIHRCIIMRGLASLKIGGAVASGFDGVDFLTAIASVSKVTKSARGHTLSSGSNQQIALVLDAPIFRPIVPTALDRTRMDRIATSTRESGQLLELLGKKMVRLRGHGGTGKTVMFLQMAWKAFDERGLRTLVLTYNHALAADIRRILALLKVPSNPEDGGVAVDTVMSFMYSWFVRLQVLEHEEELSYEDYEEHCNAALELLRGNAITSDDVAAILDSDPDRYDFDCVIVDEAQDWPQGEADLLKILYEPKKICLADGIDQLLRGERPDWGKGVNEKDTELITLNRCLRMKSNLAVFVSQVAEIGGVKWETKPNDKAGGGRILVLTKPYYECRGLHEELLGAAKGKGNSELDFLFCVPPSSVLIRGDKKQSDIAKYLSEAGYETWDGVDVTARRDFPRSKYQFRVVQYASCRGLEGWTVVLHNVDQYWMQCKVERETQGLTTEQELAFEDLDDIASRHAWHRVLIALTRPIDTLVISIDESGSSFSRALLEVANMNKEFIRVIN